MHYINSAGRLIKRQFQLNWIFLTSVIILGLAIFVHEDNFAYQSNVGDILTDYGLMNNQPQQAGMMAFDIEQEPCIPIPISCTGGEFEIQECEDMGGYICNCECILPPEEPPSIPIDGGLAFLLGAGGLYGLKRLTGKFKK